MAPATLHWRQLSRTLDNQLTFALVHFIFPFFPFLSSVENKTHRNNIFVSMLIDIFLFFFPSVLLPLISSVRKNAEHRGSIKVRAKVSRLSRYYQFVVKRHLRHRFVMTTTMTISLVYSTPIILFYFTLYSIYLLIVFFNLLIFRVLYFSINSFSSLLENCWTKSRFERKTRFTIGESTFPRSLLRLHSH